MNLLEYIKGKRKGKDANRIEKDSMKDPFLYEAIEGFDSIDDNHIDRINKIKKLINAKSVKAEKRSPIWQSVAASLILILGVGGYFLIDGHKSNLHAQENGYSGIIEIYVPEQFYTENIAIIAQKNTILVKKYKPSIKYFNVNEDISSNITQAELDILAGDMLANSNPIDIYIPNANNREPKNINRPGSSVQSDKFLAPEGAVTLAMTNVDDSFIDLQTIGDSDDNLIVEATTIKAPVLEHANKSIHQKIKKEEPELVVKQSTKSGRADSKLRHFQAGQTVMDSGTNTFIIQPLIGYEQYNAYLKSALVHPDDTTCKDKKGEVVIEFSIDEGGQPHLFEIKQGLCDTSDKEAIRVIRSGSKWTPTSQRVTVKVTF